MPLEHAIHIFYLKEDFIKLDAEFVEGITSWRYTEGGTASRDIGCGVGFAFRSQTNVCFCEGEPCEHADFTGSPTERKVQPSTQEKADREKATDFIRAIDKGTPVATQGDLRDSTAAGEPLWLSIAQGKVEVNKKKFPAAGGVGTSGTRMIAEGWSYVNIECGDILNPILLHGNAHLDPRVCATGGW